MVACNNVATAENGQDTFFVRFGDMNLRDHFFSQIQIEFKTRTTHAAEIMTTHPAKFAIFGYTIV